MWQNTWDAGQLKGISSDVMNNDNSLRWQFSVWQVSFAIKSKGGDCWHYDTSVVLDGNSHRWQIIVQQVSSKELMIRLQRMKKEEYIRRFTIYQVVYTRRFTIYQVPYICRFAIYQVVYTHRLYMQVHYIQMHVHTRDCWSKVVYVYAHTFMHGKAHTCGKAYFSVCGI